MANPSLQPIYNRMNGVSNYHPYTADTFADWSLEAGDIVTVSQDGKAYSSPVHATTLRWTGQQQMELESNGEKEREPLAKMSAKAYNTGNGGGNGYRGGYGGSKRDKDHYTLIKNNADAIRLEAVDRRNADNQFEASLTVQADKIEAEVSARQSADSKMSGRITVNSDKVGMVVEETSGGYAVKAASIVASINDAGSSVAISADHVYIDGNTKLNGVVTVNNGALVAKNGLVVSGSSGNVTINNGKINAPTIQVNSGGSLVFGGSGQGAYASLSYSDIDTMVTDASASGNVLTLTTKDGRTINFSKATTLSGAWSGGTYTVTAKQNGTTVKSISEIITGTSINGTPTLNPGSDHYIDAVIEVTAKELGESGTGATVYSVTKTINASAAWQAGYDSAPGETHTHHLSLTYNRTEELPSGTIRYHYYTTGSAIHTSGSKQVYW